MKELLGWSLDGALDPWSCFYLAEVWVRTFFHAVEGGKDFFVPPKVIFNIFNSNTNKQSKRMLKEAI